MAIALPRSADFHNNQISTTVKAYMIDLEHPKLNVTQTEPLNTRAVAEQIKHFKLRLSLPGKNIGGEWLCRLTGAALAYKNYCGTRGTPRVFGWYEYKGKTYLHDQEGNWLSWETTANCLYMSSWTYAAAWKVEGGRLIRVSDNAVASWVEKQRWPLADEHFLQALAPSNAALTVEVVDAQLPMDAILQKMEAVFKKRHQAVDANDPDRYQFTTNPEKVTAVYSDELTGGDSESRHIYQKGELAFFEATGEVKGETTAPVYVLRRWSKEERRSYYKLSMKEQEEGYAVDPREEMPGPKFEAFTEGQNKPYLVAVYEHSAPTATPGLRRYTYDFIKGAHDGWSDGKLIFYAVTPEAGIQALVGSVKGQNAMDNAKQWLSTQKDFGQILRGLKQNDVNRNVIDDLSKSFKEVPVPIKYITLGGGVHGGYGVGTVGMEMGSIWRFADFGYVPMHEPLADYSVEWVTFGVTGVDLGASADLLALGIWFGEISQIEGACNGITLSGQFVTGATVNILWDGSWLGVNYTPHPIGVTIVMTAGLEAGVGVFYNASATQFWNKRKNFPST